MILLPDFPVRSPDRLVVLISGTGSNLQAVIDAIACGILPARVSAVFSNCSNAYGLERARRTGIPAFAVPKPKDMPRQAYDAALAEKVAAFRPDWVLLLGWMRILSSDFLQKFPSRVLNLHPALPGAFPGTHAIERTYEAYKQGLVKYAGVMVHLVPDEGVDCGPVLGQMAVPIRPADTLSTLEARIHMTEHRLLVNVLEVLLSPAYEETVEPVISTRTISGRNLHAQSYSFGLR